MDSKIINDINIDISGSQKTSTLQTLLELRTTHKDNLLLFENVGTGSYTHAETYGTMNVTSGQYQIRKSKHIAPYFAGKAQTIEMTVLDFHRQDNVSKKIGYFSSSTTSPYNSGYDGFFVEDDGITKNIQIWNNGILVKKVEQNKWYNQSKTQNHNFENFTVFLFEFLWLGGAHFRVFLKTENGFVLLYDYSHTGNSHDTIFRFPQHPARYDIYSSTGTGVLTPICALVGTSSTFDYVGTGSVISTGSTALAPGVVGTKYPILVFKKKSSTVHKPIMISDQNIFVNSADQGMWSLDINLVISGGAITYNTTGHDYVDYFINTGATRTITSLTNPTIAQGFLAQTTILDKTQLESTISRFLSSQISGEGDVFALSFTPLSANTTVYANITFLEL